MILLCDRVTHSITSHITRTGTFLLVPQRSYTALLFDFYGVPSLWERRSHRNDHCAAVIWTVLQPLNKPKSTDGKYRTLAFRPVHVAVRNNRRSQSGTLYYRVVGSATVYVIHNLLLHFPLVYMHVENGNPISDTVLLFIIRFRSPYGARTVHRLSVGA